MSKILSSLNLNQNEIKNVVIHNLTSAPKEPKKGQIYFNTIDNKFYVYENETWSSYLTLEELEEKYYDKSQIDNMISAAGGFPDQTDNGGKVLTTDGTSPSWNYIINMNDITNSESEGVSNLVINKLTQAEYDELLKNNQINDDEFYAITDANLLFATKDEIPTLTSQLTNDSGFITEIPSEYITETELNDKGYLTEHQDISGKADKETTYTKEEVDELIENIDVSGATLPEQTDNAGKVLVTDGETASWDYVINMNNVTESKSEGVSKLVINKLTQAEYDELLANNQINDNEIYLTSDDSNIPTKISDLENDSGFITLTDIESKAEKSEIPTLTSQLTNDSGFITEHQDISGKADITYVDEQVGSITEQVNELSSKISSVYSFKGSISSVTSLPTTATIGDVYNVEDTGMNYAWTGTEWDSLGIDIDLSSYYTKTEVDEIIDNIEVSGGDSLPNQVDNTGKFLTTDGETASWDYVINMNNVTESTSEGVSKLVINKLTQAEYDELKAKGQINPNELYMTTDNSGDKNITKLSELENDVGFITEIPSEYITETELDTKGYLTEHQDISGKADKETTYTKEEVDESFDSAYQTITLLFTSQEQLASSKADKESTYTKNEVNDLIPDISTKQDVLTPGNGITIIDNVISSTGGTGTSLPDQTDNSGKVLTTDGISPSWNHIINMNDVSTSTTEGVSNLVINKLTQAEYDELVANNQINDNEFYAITDANMSFATKDYVNEQISNLTERVFTTIITVDVNDWSTDNNLNSTRLPIDSLLSTDIVWVSPLASIDGINEDIYVESGIRAVTQEDGVLTCYCKTIPTESVQIQIINQRI